METRSMLLRTFCAFTIAASLWFWPAIGHAQSSCSGAYAVTQTFNNGATWDLCWELRQREGVVLHDVYYTNTLNQRRRVLGEASVAQIHVPYDDNGARYHDVSDYGLGDSRHLNNLQSVDCPNGRLVNATGVNALCLETIQEAAEPLLGEPAASYLRLFSVSHVGAYNYIPEWRFHDDGKIEPLMGATGRLQRYGSDPARGWNTDNNSGNPIGIAHLHNYYWRLDFDLGASGNDDVFEEIDTQPNTSVAGAGISRQELLIESGRDVDASKFRLWRVRDGQERASNNRFIGYDVLLRETGHRDIGPASEPWTRHDVYVTRHRGCERFASRNPSDQLGGCGSAGNLATFTNGEGLDGEDIVVWVGISFHHLPRNEDEPDMPAHWNRFELTPRDWTDDSSVSGSSSGGSGSSGGSSGTSSGSSSGGASSSSGGGVADACPNGIFDNGFMYDGDRNYTENSCALAGQTCYPIYFYARASYETAQCSSGQWVVAGTSGSSGASSSGSGSSGSGSGGASSGGASSSGGSSGGGSTPDACPNGVFANGYMYDGDVQYTQNQCNLNGQDCTSVYFYALGRYDNARCESGAWRVRP